MYLFSEEYLDSYDLFAYSSMSFSHHSFSLPPPAKKERSTIDFLYSFIKSLPFSSPLRSDHNFVSILPPVHLPLHPPHVLSFYYSHHSKSFI